MFQSLTRLKKWLGRLRDPKPLSIEEWAAHHEVTVQRDLERVLPYLPAEGGVYVDVGANIGLFSDHLMRRRPASRAYLFEPVHKYFLLCQERFAGRDEVVVENLAMSDHNGEATIWKSEHNFGGNSMVEDLMFDRRECSMVSEDTVFHEETIQCRVFDDYAREHGIERVDLIKTDTEGHDYAVLRGMLPFIERCDPKPIIFSELMAEWYHPQGEQQAEVMRALFDLGYQEVDMKSMEKIGDVLFLPEGVERIS
jgi:FkbM family methyltransferase